MAKKYLDDNGVRYLWTKLKNWVNSVVPSKTDVAANTEARHTHTNSGILDSITADKIDSWGAGVENYIVTVTQDEDNATATNWQGLEAAFAVNKRVYCVVNGGLILPLLMFFTGESATFVGSMAEDNMIVYTTVTVSLTDGSTTVEQSINNVPSKTSDLTNDSGFITSADGGNAAAVNGIKIVTASAAPTNAENNTITFVV